MALLRAIPRALGNMAREAWRNPLWAIISLALAPFEARYWLLIACGTAFLVWAVFGLADQLTLTHYGLTKADWLYRAVMYGNLGLALFVLAGLTVVPLIARFADYSRDAGTHESARFATPPKPARSSRATAC